MANTVPSPAARRHVVLPDISRPRMAKAVVRKPDTTDLAKVAAACQRAVLRVWETNQLAAAALGIDDAQFGKWMSGSLRPHLDKLLAHPALHWPLVVELGKLDGTVEEVTELRRRRA